MRSLFLNLWEEKRGIDKGVISLITNPLVGKFSCSILVFKIYIFGSQSCVEYVFAGNREILKQAEVEKHVSFPE